jgi:uncharacterized membrane protein YuzA (DUF378 family)
MRFKNILSWCANNWAVFLIIGMIPWAVIYRLFGGNDITTGIILLIIQISAGILLVLSTTLFQKYI